MSVCVSDTVGPSPAKTLKHTERELKIPKVQVGGIPFRLHEGIVCVKETAYPVGKSAQNGANMCVSKGKKLLEITMDLDGSMEPTLELSTRTAAIFKTLCNSSGQTSTRFVTEFYKKILKL